MEMSNLSSRKRPRSFTKTMLSLDLDQREGAKDASNSASNKGLNRSRATSYRSAVCLSVLLVQLARVQSWSPSFSIAKKSAPKGVLLSNDSVDAAFWASLQPTIPSSEFLSSRYLVANSNNNNKNKNQLTMVASTSPPSMLLPNDFFFPVSSKSLATSDCVKRGIETGGNSLQAPCDIDREGRVLGFDVFELQATRSDDQQFQQQQTQASNNSDAIPWQNAPLPNTANDNLEAAAAAMAAMTRAKTTNNNNNGGVRLIKNSSPHLPAWFPWVPTKSQIMTLKHKELKEACSQRGLKKVRS